MFTARNLYPLLMVGVIALVVLLPENAHAEQPLEKIFSTILKNFVDTLDHVKDQLLTKFYGEVATAAKALGTLYILFYGIEILLAPSQLNAREALGRMAKVAIVVSLMTGAGTLDMNDVYKFFYSLAFDVSKDAVSYLSSSWLGNLSSPTSIYTKLDGIVAEIIKEGKLGELDIVKLLGFSFAALMVAPSIGTPLIQLFFQIFMIVANSLLGIFLAMATITFLVCLGPLFVGFALFQLTNHLFENWWRHLASYALQIVFVFAALGLWATNLAGYKDFLKGMNDALFPYKVSGSLNAGGVMHYDDWAVRNCKTTGKKYDCQAGGASGPAFLTAKDLQTGQYGREFIKFFFINIISLLVLTFAFGALVQQAPGIAQQITGAGGSGADAAGTGLASLMRKANTHVKNMGKDDGSSDSSNGGSLMSDGQKNVASSFIQQFTNTSGRRKDPGA